MSEESPLEEGARVSREARAYRYDHVAWCYEAIAWLGSLGAIPQLKAAQLDWMPPGARVLYVGAGAGEDVVLAVQRGFEVSALDRSPRMLARLRARLMRAGRGADLIERDLNAPGAIASHDVVVANFFLNVFGPREVGDALRRCREALAPDGLLFLGDFRPADRGRANRLLYDAYYKPLNLGAWALGLCALHPIYDYATWLDEAGFALIERRPQRLLGKGPAFYETIIARAK